MSLSSKPVNHPKRCLAQLEVLQPTPIFDQTETPVSKFFPGASSQCMYEASLLPRNPGVLLQIFAYQYLKLCFCNPDGPRGEKYKESLYELIQRPEFEFIIPDSAPELQGYSTIALKNLISQYLNHMASTSETVLWSLSKYPLMLRILTAFLYTLLVLGEAVEGLAQCGQIQRVYEFLCSYFDVCVFVSEGSAFFSQANVYVWDEDGQVYMFCGGEAEKQPNRSPRSIVEQQNLLKSRYSKYASGKKLTFVVPSQNLLPDNICEEQVQAPAITKKEAQTESQMRQIQTHTKNLMSCESKISYNYTESINTSYVVEDELGWLKLAPKEADREGMQETLDLDEALVNDNKSCSAISSSILGSQLHKTVQPAQDIRKKTNKSNYYYEAEESDNVEKENIFQDELFKKIFKSSFGVNNGVQFSTSSATSSFIKKPEEKENYGLNTAKTSDTFYRPTNLTVLKPTFTATPLRWVNHNITKQFTDSIVLQAMAEPYRSGIELTKKRAREVRKNAFFTLK